MILKDLPDDPNKAEKEAVRRFRLLRTVIFEILPEDCPLKTCNILAMTMVVSLDADVVKNGFVESKDICALCQRSECPHFNVDNKSGRILKIKMLEDFGKVQ